LLSFLNFSSSSRKVFFAAIFATAPIRSVISVPLR
jgi:hypothetical protein